MKSVEQELADWIKYFNASIRIAIRHPSLVTDSLSVMLNILRLLRGQYEKVRKRERGVI